MRTRMRTKRVVVVTRGSANGRGASGRHVRKLTFRWFRLLRAIELKIG